MTFDHFLVIAHLTLTSRTHPNRLLMCHRKAAQVEVEIPFEADKERHEWKRVKRGKSRH